MLSSLDYLQDHTSDRIRFTVTSVPSMTTDSSLCFMLKTVYTRESLNRMPRDKIFDKVVIDALTKETSRYCASKLNCSV